MSRRVTGALLLAALLSVAVALAPAGGEAKKRKKAKPPRPNIVLIMDDDQSVNLQQFLTKTNAAIAGKGVTFDNSFVNYSLCCPSRSTDVHWAVRAQPRGAEQHAAHRRLQQARPDDEQHPAGLAAGLGLLHGAYRQVPERLRHDGPGHRGPTGLE